MGCPSDDAAPGAPGGLSRRHFVGALGAAAALGGTKRAYRRAEAILGRPARPAGATSTARELPAEQYRYLDLESVTDRGVSVLVPPVHRLVVTATLATGTTPSALQAGQRRLESTLSDLEAGGTLTATPAGCGLAVGWGIPYFSKYVPHLRDHLPLDRSSAAARSSGRRAVTDAMVFPSDHQGNGASTLLEANEVVFVLGSDTWSHILACYDAIFGGATGRLFHRTSERRGFVDARHVGTGTTSFTKQKAERAGLPGAGDIPDSAELFLGFTSTQTAALAPGRVPSFETLPGFTDQVPGSYFAGGTAMSLSHIYEDLAAWYAAPFSDRVAATFSPRLSGSVPAGTQTVAEGSGDLETIRQLDADAASANVCGHASVMQPVSRLARSATDRYGRTHPAGTPLMFRADVNTLDSPFFWSAHPTRDKMSSSPGAGLHFVAFTPTTSVFDAIRLAMDGYLPGQSSQLPTLAFTRNLTTTHRQNFLVPPRAHRSFPLAELL